MKLKKIEKFAIILTGLLFLTLTLYFLLLSRSHSRRSFGKR